MSAPRLWAAALVAACTIGGCSEDGLPEAPSGTLPVLLSVEPDTILAADAIRIVLNGFQFDAGFRAHLNRYSFTVEQSDTWGLYVDLPPWAVLAPGTYELTVSDPESPGRESAPLDIVVLDRRPQIRALTPVTATAGSGPMSLTVAGRFFGDASEVAWNGTPRLTEQVENGDLQIELSSADLALPGAGLVTVIKDGNDPSEPLGLPIMPSLPAAVSSLDTLALVTSGLVPDPVRNLVYAVVPASAPAHANEFVAIDPVTASIVWTEEAFDAVSPVVSEDGSYAYVAANAAWIERLDLEAHSQDLNLAVPANTTRAIELTTVPGMPGRVVAAFARLDSNPQTASVAVYDGGTLQPDRVGGFEDMKWLEPSDRPTRVFAFGDREFRTLRLFPTGITIFERDTVDYFGGFGWDMVEDNGWVFGTNGIIVDAEWSVPVARFPVQGPVRPDAANGRVHFLVGDELVTMSLLDQTELGRLSVPEAAGSSIIVRFGADGLAFGGGQRVVFMRSGLVGG